MTDAAGRVKSIEANLFLKEMDRNTYQQRCVGKCGEVGDEGGHLIASSLGRAGDRINLVSQASALNRIGWRKMENEFAKALQEGKSISVKIDLSYLTSIGVSPNQCAAVR
ncbi:DNA/RNA non-specific endonuclease [Xylella fastidiosa]|uniref:DNA/RNA non-specific endonuclease n=1 Tax=Xylella fastidiosa TaxID=2371 RepID=UPI000733448C